MKKEELIRYRAGLAALLVSGSMFLSGCTSSAGFEFLRGDDNKLVADTLFYINNKCINKCSVVEVYHKLTDETKIYIIKKENETVHIHSDKERTYDYIDLLTDTLLFNTDNNENFEIINETSLYDYIVSLDLIQERYSYKDMERIFEEIKSIYEFEKDKELVK